MRESIIIRLETDDFDRILESIPADGRFSDNALEESILMVTPNGLYEIIFVPGSK